MKFISYLGVSLKLETRELEAGKLQYNKLKIVKNEATEGVALLKEIDKILSSTKSNIENDTIEKAINWCRYKNKWLLNEYNDLENDFYNYKRGDVIISLDLGTLNIGTEIRYPHPCVVLYDNGEDWIVVAPITAAQIDETTGNPIIHEFEVYAEKQKKKPRNKREFYFTKHSVIQVDQIYRVSKHRIINRQRKKIREDLINQIDNIMLKKYIPKKYELLKKIEEMNNEVNKKNDLLMEKISDYEDLIEVLNERIANLEKEIKNQ